MRLHVSLVALAACVGEPPASGIDANQMAEEGGGGLPPPACGAGVCSECVGCSLASGLCMSLEAGFAVGIGQCHARSQGSLVADDGPAPFVATAVAAVANDSYMQISGTAGAGHTLAMQVPAQLGSFECASTTAAWFVYYSAAGVAWNRPVSDRPACSVTVSALGAVGAPIEGTFTIAFGTTVLANGSFSVVRAAYP